MPHATCAHCQVPISDHATMVERNGQTYCCNNCAQMAAGGMQQGSGGATCAHCQMPIVDRSSQVESGGQTFCCNNCAQATAQSGVQATAHGSTQGGGGSQVYRR